MSDSIVIIPTYNEKENIEKIIKAVFQLDKQFHILIVDDNSPDGTADIVKKLQEKHSDALYILERAGKQGLGTAYIAGFKYALDRNYEYIYEMDADFSHPPHNLIDLYEACKNKGGDLAVGSRYKNGVNVVNWPMSRVLMSYFASKYVKFITGLPINDSTAGYKCYTKKVLQRIKLDKIKFKGYAFQIEMKYLAWKLGFKLVEVPIIFTDRKEGQSKMSMKIFKEAFWGVLQMGLTNFAKKHK